MNWIETETRFVFFPIPSHIFVACKKSNSTAMGPSMEILTRLSKVLLFTLFLRSVFMLLIMEKTHSQSAVDTGRTIV